MPIHPPLLIILLIKIISAFSQEAEFDIELDNLTGRVLGDHFDKVRCVVYLLDEDLRVDFRHRVPVIVIRLPVEREILTECFDQGCGGFVIRARNKSEAAGLLIEAKHRATGNRYNKEKYLFLPADETDVDLELMNHPSKLFFLPNMVLMIPESGDLSAVTHTVFDHHKHDLLGVTHEVLDVWAPGRGFASGGDLYPDKLSDVKGKKFVFALLNYSPFSLVIKVGNKTLFDGFETRIAAEFVDFVNGTWEGMDHPVNLWGEVFSNGTGSGAIGSVMSHKADFGFSAIYQWFCDECDCSYPFYQSGVTCLVPRPKLVSGWHTIVLPFETETWLALIIVYFISSTFIFGLLLTLQKTKGYRIKDQLGMAISDSFFTNFRLQLEQIPVISNIKEPLSVYVKISVFYYFFVAAFWQGGISSILTVPRFEKPINDASDLVDGWPKIKWGANSEAWINSIRASSEPNLVEIVNKFVTLDDETLKKKARDGDFGFFVEKLPHGHYGHSDYITEESMKYLRLMENHIYNAFGVIILPRGSPFSEKFDHIVLWLFDTGIIHKIEVQVSLERINNRLQNMIEYSNLKEANTVILAIRHIQGPLYIYAGGMSLAVLVFFLEIFFVWTKSVFTLER